jgi:hypothetical protein
MSVAECMEGDIHDVCGAFDDALQFVANGALKRVRGEVAQSADQVRNPVGVGGTAALVNRQYIHALTVRR